MQGIRIKINDNMEVIDTTHFAEIRASQADYLERRYKRMQKRHQKKKNNLLWKLACYCGII